MKRHIHYLLFALIILNINQSFADKRNYVWTYQYKTVERGAAEVENYFTLSTPDTDSMHSTMSTEHRIELEFGMSDRFDFAVYQIFGQDPGGYFKYKGFQLRSRLRLSEKGQFIFDPLLYLEYKGEPSLSSHGIEFKLIMAKDIGRFNFSFNPVNEFEFGYLHDLEFKPKYTFGMNYELLPLLNFGFEFKGSENGHYWGPVVSHGHSDFWVAMGAAFSIGNIQVGEPEFQTRLLIGIDF